MDMRSDETERLCEMTADLLKNFQRLLLDSRRKQVLACPCGRECQGQQRLEAEQLPRQYMQPPPPPQPTTLCSNVSNLATPLSLGRVMTSPSEIFLLLRLESWLDESGVLVVKPSIHRASSADSTGLSSAANNNTTVRLQTAAAVAQPGTSETEDAAGDGCDDAGDSGPADGFEMKDLLVQLQQLQQLQEHQQQQQQHQQLHHNNSRRQLQPKLSLAHLAPVATSGSGSGSGGRSRQQHPQALSHRRERALAKRTASVGSGVAPAAAAGSAVRAGRGRRSPAPPGESIALIKQLHRLLGTQLKTAATAE